MDIIVGILKLLGSLGVFLYGMKITSDSLQKIASNKLQKTVDYMTQNRFFAVATGLIATAIIQSSSATTVMIVSFVNASLLNLSQAIGVIMGANIGTTITTWIVSFFGFKFKISAIALPIIGIGLPFLFLNKERLKYLGEVFMGLGILFLGITFLKDAVPDMKNNTEILSFLQYFNDMGFIAIPIFILVGALLTVVVQSSSAAMTITVAMAYKGWINFPLAAAIVLGENIGTTVTAYIASWDTNTNAKRAARAHFLFNVFGVAWMLFIFNYFLKFISAIAPWDASLQQNLPLNLALFHTIFNIINTLICISFVDKIAMIVSKIVKEKPNFQKGSGVKSYNLKYLSTTMLNTAEFDLVAAKKEILNMNEIVEKMFNTFLSSFNSADKQKLTENCQKLKEDEVFMDKMQIKITRYLIDCSKKELTNQNLQNINYMIKTVNDLENISDYCYQLMTFLKKKTKLEANFHEKSSEEINNYSKTVFTFMELNKSRLNEHMHKSDYKKAIDYEKEIDHMKYSLKQGSVKRLQKGANIEVELIYIDVIRVLEKIGDYSLNISKSLLEIKN